MIPHTAPPPAKFCVDRTARCSAGAFGHRHYRTSVGLSVRSPTIEHMIELVQGRHASPAASLPELADVDRWIAALQADTRELDDTQRVDLLRALEQLTCAAAGTQAVLTAELDDSMRCLLYTSPSPRD